MSTWTTGAEAAELTGKTIAEIDAAAASGAIDAQYQGWQLMVSSPETRTVAELKAILDERGVEYPPKALKADLIELVEESD